MFVNRKRHTAPDHTGHASPQPHQTRCPWPHWTCFPPTAPDALPLTAPDTLPLTAPDRTGHAAPWPHQTRCPWLHWTRCLPTAPDTLPLTALDRLPPDRPRHAAPDRTGHAETLPLTAPDTSQLFRYHWCYRHCSSQTFPSFLWNNSCVALVATLSGDEENTSKAVTILFREHVPRQASLMHCKKRQAIFLSPAAMSLTKLSMAGNN